jgi:hypothetical protein
LGLFKDRVRRMEWINFQTGIPWFPITMIALCAVLGLYMKAHAKRNPITLLEKFERELLAAQKIERDKGV